MKRDLAAFEGTCFDLLVVGGGIFGACAAWDAAQRGLSVALIERSDFGGATSAHSYKLVHSGIRYMQHADVRRMRASSAERRAFLRIAPHLVHPLPIVVPTYGAGRRGRHLLAAGLAAYDLLTWDRNRGIRDPARRVPVGRMMSRDETRACFPGLEADGLTGAGVFADGQMYDPPRLVLAVVKSAVACGAVVANHLEATRLVQRSARAEGVEAHDRLTGATLEIRARVVLNAAGPYAEAFLQRSLDLPRRPPGTYSRDVCFVVPRPWVSPTHALAVQGRTRDPDAFVSRGERHLFVAPWRGASLVGTWHRVHTGDPWQLGVSERELAAFADEVNAGYEGLEVSVDEITVVNQGLVPFGENPEGSIHLRYGHRSRVIDHDRADGVGNLISMIGVRFTTGRREAERAVDLAFRKLGVPAPPCRTSKTPVVGGDIPDWAGFLDRLSQEHGEAFDAPTVQHLARTYGTEASRVMALARRLATSGSPVDQASLLRARVQFAVQEEMAKTLADLVFRRTDLGTIRHPGKQALAACARLLGEALDLPASRTESQLTDVENRFFPRSATPAGA